MRVGIDARLMYYQQAGIGTYVSKLIREIATLADSPELTILLSRKDKTSFAEMNRFRKASVWTPSHHRFEQVFLPLELVGRGIDLLHSPDFIPPLTRRCKSVITIHDLAFLFYSNILTDESRRYYTGVHRAARSANAIIAVSSSTKRDIIEQLGVAESKVFVVHNGVDAIFTRIEDSRSLHESNRRFGIQGRFILFVGTVEPRKNLATLLSAFTAIVSGMGGDRGEPGPEPQLVIAGRQGWLCDDVLALVRSLGLSDKVIFTGQVEAHELLALYNAADFLVQPSIYEGFGLPPLEAMACGTPCIVSNVSSLPEVVGDAAIKVDPLDIGGWTEAMLRLLWNADLRSDLAQRGFARSKQFAWSTTARETLEVYRLVAEGSIQA